MLTVFLSQGELVTCGHFLEFGCFFSTLSFIHTTKLITNLMSQVPPGGHCKTGENIRAAGLRELCEARARAGERTLLRPRIVGVSLASHLGVRKANQTTYCCLFRFEKSIDMETTF